MWQILKRILDGKPVIIPGDGSSLWTLTHSKDFAKGYVGLMANPHAIGNAFHITTDESMTWNQIYQTIADALGKPVLVMRDTTERPEGVEAGTLKLAGTKMEDIYRECRRLLTEPEIYRRMSEARNKELPHD